MSDISPQVLNELFIQKLGTQEGLDKIAMEGSAFIRNKLREVSYARKVINPEYVTKLDLQRSTLHDGLTKIVDIEPDSTAVAINLRGQAPTRYVEGQRYEIPFYMITSEDFQKTEEELLAYEMPLTEVIERNSIKDIQAVEDSRFLAGVDAAIALDATQSVTGTLTNSVLGREGFKTLFDVLDGSFLKCETMLMNSKTFNSLFLYPSTTVGDQVGSEQHINGFTYSTLFGRKLIVTNKTSGDGAVADNTVYAFTAQEFLGNFYILVDTKFWVDKKKNLITWAAYETIGMGIGNANACAKCLWS